MRIESKEYFESHKATKQAVKMFKITSKSEKVFLEVIKKRLCDLFDRLEYLVPDEEIIISSPTLVINQEVGGINGCWHCEYLSEQ